MPYVQYIVQSGVGALITDRPNVAAWWQRVSARPSWKKIVA
jgi:glutathione S-transferase